ncbi:MAG TPA: biopolymer transporter ExbD [Gammaproteobacteria bacterium]|jgi:biopolymer transport protein ExbD
MRKHHYHLKTEGEAELAVTTFLNLMVVLVPFLLITAVFSRLTIVELNLPSATGGGSPTDIGFRPEVIVRESGIEVTNGNNVIASIPKVAGEYDIATLSRLMLSLKQDYAEVEDMSVLLEPQIPYDYLIRVMDAVRTAEIPDATVEGGLTRVALFTAISVGEAP